MPRGLPDYYNPDTLVSQRLANVEEIVTAVQGIANIDNRGKTLTFDNFSEGVSGWVGAKGGDGVVPVGSILKAEIGPASMRMDAGTATGSGISYAYKRFRIQEISSAGFEFGLAYELNAVRLGIFLQYDNGTNLLFSGLRINMTTYKVQMRDGAAYTDLITLDPALGTEDWLTIKLVVDFANGVYVRLLIGQTQYDISGYSVHSLATAYAGQLIAFFTATSLDDAGDIVYIGHAAITIDEP